MCTLSWIETPAGRELFFNRDERRTRGPEGPPQLWTAAPIPFLAPLDQEAGGTWLAVNAEGIAVALLNGYHERRGPTPAQARSRGWLVRDLAGSLSEPQWSHPDPTPFEPFTLFLFSAEAVRAYRWDGLECTRIEHPSAPSVSSSFEPDRVRPHREALWSTWQAGGPPRDRAAALAYHRHAPEGGDALSPSMSRPDAQTRSLCHILLGEHEVSLTYAPGPPHSSAFGPPLTLARRSPRLG